MFTQSGNVFYAKNSGDITVETLPLGVYDLQFEKFRGFFLVRKGDSFELPSRIYDLEKKFIDKVVNVYRSNVARNLGVLLSGLKGSGKTVTAKILCHSLGLPIIMVNTPYAGLRDYLNDLPCDYVAFFDEFEKGFANSPNEDDGTQHGSPANALLTLMDGVLGDTYRRFFLLTCNDIVMNSAFRDRPGRIRYLKKFSNISRKAASEIIVDRLRKDGAIAASEVLNYLETLEYVTVDIVSSVIDEINVTGTLPEDFNVNKKTVYILFQKDTKNGGWFKKGESRYSPFGGAYSNTEEESAIYFNNSFLGYLKTSLFRPEEVEFTVKYEEGKSKKTIDYKIVKSYGDSVMDDSENDF